MNANKPTILLVDDECEIRNMLRIVLNLEDYDVIEAETGEAALQTIGTRALGLIVLDLRLPDMDGMQIIAETRQFSNVPIVVLTASTEDHDLVQALKKGANDYVTKPFNLDVLLARISANLRTHDVPLPDTGTLSNGRIKIDLERHEVHVDGQLTAFSPKEFDLLSAFVRNKGKMMTHRQILREVWGPSHTDDTHYIRVYLGQVRAKLARVGDFGSAIVCEQGVGYRMDVLSDDTALSGHHA